MKEGGRIFADVVTKIISETDKNGRRITKRDFARNMGISDSNFGNKMRRDTFNVSETVTTLNALGFDVIVRDKITNDEYNMRNGEFQAGEEVQKTPKNDGILEMAEKLGLTVVLKDKNGSEIVVKN